MLIGFIALAVAILLAAWILSARLDRPALPSVPAEPAPAPVPAEPAPPPVQPRADWKAAAAAVDDVQAVSALILAFEGRWPDAQRHVRAMYRVGAGGDVKAAREHNEAGLAYFRKNEFAAAAQAFDRASRADPADAEIANNLGYALMKAGRIGDAMPHLLRALHLVPGRSSAWANLAEALAQLGHEDAALAALLLAVRFRAKRDEIRDYLAESAKTHSSAAFRRQSARALERMDSVPRG